MYPLDIERADREKAKDGQNYEKILRLDKRSINDDVIIINRFANMMASLRQSIHRFSYRQETGFKLNHITLAVDDPHV